MRSPNRPLPPDALRDRHDPDGRPRRLKPQDRRSLDPAIAPAPLPALR